MLAIDPLREPFFERGPKGFIHGLFQYRKKNIK